MPRCGTINAYTAGCRCDACRLVKRESQRAYEARRKAGLLLTPRTFEHGTLTRYRHGCQCDDCREAAAEHRRKYARRNKTQAVETPAPKPPKAEPVRFQHDLVNLHHAMTIEDWREREAADPGCRPVTQPPIRLRRETLPDVHGEPTMVDAAMADALWQGRAQ